MDSSDSFVGRGGSFLPNQSSGQSSTLSKKIQALESSGFSPDEIAEVFKRLGSAAAAGDGSQYRGGSISSWVLNYALPSIVILGTGALIFLLTGGEDEPTVATENSDEDINCHNESVGDQEYDENMAPSDHRWPASLSRGRIADSDSEQNRLLMTAASSSSSVPLELDPINVNHQRDALYGEASAAWLQEVRRKLLPGYPPKNKINHCSFINFMIHLSTNVEIKSVLRIIACKIVINLTSCISITSRTLSNLVFILSLISCIFSCC